MFPIPVSLSVKVYFFVKSFLKTFLDFSLLILSSVACGTTVLGSSAPGGEGGGSVGCWIWGPAMHHKIIKAKNASGHTARLLAMVTFNLTLTQACLTCGPGLLLDRVAVLVVVRVGGFGWRFSFSGWLSLEALSFPVRWSGGIIRGLGQLFQWRSSPWQRKKHQHCQLEQFLFSAGQATVESYNVLGKIFINYSNSRLADIWVKLDFS